MSLPIETVDYIFSRLTVRFGRPFLARWDGIDLDLVKADWAQELDGFQQWPEAIVFALDNLGADKPPPTVDQFKAIARRAPAPQRKALPEPAANPERVHAEMAKLRSNMGANRKDPKDWARRILANHEAGYRVRAINLNFAREAIGVA